MIKALAILVNEQGKTIGAQFEVNGEVKNFKTEKIAEYGNSKIDNAIIDKNGFIRAKRGKLPKIIIKSKPNIVEQRDIVDVDKMIKNKTIKIYHGNKNPHMVPTFGKGKEDNDYGKGFYTE